MAKRNSNWESSIIEVLRAADEPMHFAEIAEVIAKNKMRRSLGATPANTVASTISRSINNGNDTFLKTERGYYTLREKLYKESNQKPETEESAAGIVTSIGMYWRATEVDWKRAPKLMGKQQEDSDPIDFCDQVGIYLLHDRGRVIYVGRSIDRPLGQRLYEHTRDRLNGRWERFSWFGLKEVDAHGKLKGSAPSFEMEKVVAAFEAILIESLEPPQNRKRGDHFKAVEYIQAPSPRNNNAMKQELIQQLIKQMEM
ncbi:HTH domain-containing protein [Limimaricola pyoseonensis]|uniref:HB1, ASXL, restriction endonuclease HTH domain n=1 Tax=Limimaricola pyoseonensis TaxID=521013 RepID=A0A1G7GB31_9RHOB|nr:HTH domain-containing protein [Limimaricola pyoseonensis]SDE85307.1 HB1, ASXL, restriction endonuclease HTH domain [Limimaricola pyoseonensis]